MLLALDRSSVRTFDGDGHLHVSSANISKATVNPYLGREIPSYKELGLDPNRIYKLLRDPKELEKAASTFTGKPLLIKHTPIGADDHPHDKVVGAVGPVKYEHPFLKAPLHIWPGEAIDRVKNGKQQQISCGYRYRPDMTPGSYQGEAYDGVMRDLVGNHIALVEEGRAGPDCIVGDSKENLIMAAKPLSRKAALVLGAITGHFAPRFAHDKAIDFTPVVAGLTAKNYASRVSAMPTSLMKAVEGRLAMDADIEGLVKLLDALSPASPVEAPAEGEDDAEPVMDPNAALPSGAEGAMDPEAVAKDDDADPDAAAASDDEGDDAGDAIAQARTFLASKLSPEDLNHFNSLVAKIGSEGSPAEDAEDPAAEGEAADPTNPAIPPAGENEPGEPEKKDEDMIPKSAMDAAIAAALKAENAKNKATAMAKDSVEAVLGKVIACDSASDYYRLGLKGMDVADVDALPAVALKPTFDALAASRKAAPRVPVKLAQDSAADAEFAKRFPNAGRLAR